MPYSSLVVILDSNFFKISRQNNKTQTIKKGLQVVEIACKPFICLGRHIQTRTGDLYDVNVAL